MTKRKLNSRKCAIEKEIEYLRELNAYEEGDYQYERFQQIKNLEEMLFGIECELHELEMKKKVKESA